MTETLEYRLEQSLPELQDLVHKELFTQDEVKAIIQKRTQYEHTLLRRNAKKADFLRYTEYEMNLEALRKKRQKRSKKPGRKTISDYAGPKRIGNIFKRATTRFHDIGLWLAYIEFSKLQGSPKLVGKLFGEALQKHPSSAELWILAAQYEYEQNFNISGARNLLQWSLRLNPEKRTLWLEYAKLECLYILKVMERRRILGLDRAKEEVIEDRSEFQGNEISLPTITQNELQTDVRFDPLLVSPLTDVTKNPALTGAIPMAVYLSGITSRPDDISLAAGFYDVFVPFHSKLSFIDSSLDSVKKHLEEMFHGRGKTLVVQVKDHARGITPLDKRFPGALREMMKTVSVMNITPTREQKEFREGLKLYLEEVLRTDGLDESLEKVVKIFYERIVSLK